MCVCVSVCVCACVSACLCVCVIVMAYFIYTVILSRYFIVYFGKYPLASSIRSFPVSDNKGILSIMSWRIQWEIHILV